VVLLSGEAGIGKSRLTAALLERLACFIIDLPELGGADKIRKLGVPVRTLVSFEGRRPRPPRRWH
jgi:hypothetical protein